MSYFEDVTAFHQVVLGVDQTQPRMPGPLFAQERYAFMLEELDEFSEAYFEDNLVGMADALADIVYVALGTAYQMGLPFDEIWEAVQKANMSKVRGMTARGNAIDAAKPQGWVGPEGAIAETIRNAS